MNAGRENENWKGSRGLRDLLEGSLSPSIYLWRRLAVVPAMSGGHIHMDHASMVVPRVQHVAGVSCYPMILATSSLPLQSGIDPEYDGH